MIKSQNHESSIAIKTIELMQNEGKRIIVDEERFGMQLMVYTPPLSETIVDPESGYIPLSQAPKVRTIDEESAGSHNHTDRIKI